MLRVGRISIDGLSLLSSVAAMILAIWGFIYSTSVMTSAPFVVLFMLALLRLGDDLRRGRDSGAQ